jgi:Phosphotransferase enzyme family
MMPLATPQTIAEISAAWIDVVLRGAGAIAAGQVVGVALRPIGESQGFLSSMAAVDLTYDAATKAGAGAGGPSSVVVKLEPAAGAFRDAERNYKAFEREALFYRSVAGQVDVRVPRVYHAEAGPEGSVLVMEDLTRLTCGDQVRGMRHEEVIATVRQIGLVHAAYWNNDRLASLEWLPDHDPFWSEGYAEHWPGFAREYEVRLGAEGLALGEGVLRNLDWLNARLTDRPSSFVHADLRADNLMFGEPQSRDAVVILDWQLATRSLAAIDPTRLLGDSEPASQRNGHHLEVFTAWHETLLEHGVNGYEFDEALDDFRLGALFNLLVPVLAYGLCAGTTSVRTARLLDAVVDRIYVSASELDAGSLFPKA